VGDRLAAAVGVAGGASSRHGWCDDEERHVYRHRWW
jgi:hypothetical protein